MSKKTRKAKRAAGPVVEIPVELTGDGAADAKLDGPLGPAPGKSETCPPGCVEHYTGEGGWQNHSTAPRYVTGDSATTFNHTATAGVWLEQRHGPDGEVEVVGVLEKMTSDVELSPCGLRLFARHVLAVADQVEAATRQQLATELQVHSDYQGDITLRMTPSSIDSAVHLQLGGSGEDIELPLQAARTLGTALISVAGGA